MADQTQDRIELLKIALFAAQELRAALDELGYYDTTSHVWETILEQEAEEAGVDPNNLGISSLLKPPC